MAEISIKKRRFGWMAFDWATQPFYTLGLTFIFGPFWTAAAVEQLSPQYDDVDAARAASQSIWFWGQMAAGLVIALTAPIIGAYADSTGRRMPWVWLFSLVFLPCTWALWLANPDGSNVYLMLLLFNVSFIAVEFLLVFVNAILPSLGNQQEVGKISGDGAAIGYWGGVLALFIMLLFLAENESGKTLLGTEPLFGLDPTLREGTRSVGPFIVIWFLLFMIPFFLWVREPSSPNRGGGMGEALTDLKVSLIGAYRRKSLFNFLLSSMFYRDALNVLYVAGGVVATNILGWSIIQIGVFGIIAAITAAIATQIGGIFDKRIGPHPVIRFCCYVLILVVLVIVGLDRESFFGLIQFSETSNVPDIVFYICGASIGGAGGALYAASRSMMVRHTHPERPTEAFGLFALSGKATAFMAPGLVALFTYLTGSQNLGYLPVIFLFIIGLWLFSRVNPEGDAEEWSKSAVPAP